jgi:hypothetical protein
MPYEARLSDGVKLPDGFSINKADPRYQALEALATREKWSQAAFSDVLSIEARRVSGEHERDRAAPAPAPAPAAKPFAEVTTREQMHYALERSAAARRGS